MYSPAVNSEGCFVAKIALRHGLRKYICAAMSLIGILGHYQIASASPLDLSENWRPTFLTPLFQEGYEIKTSTIARGDRHVLYLERRMPNGDEVRNALICVVEGRDLYENLGEGDVVWYCRELN